MPKRPNQGPCAVIGCGRPIEIKTMCGKHYRMQRLYGRTELKNTGDKFSHPLYRIWYERKDRNSLCPEWANDFWAMVTAIGDRPDPDFTLKPVTPHKPYGPGNWRWVELLKRGADEPLKAFNARKWASRRERDPTYEGGRSLKRKYGITPEVYAEMLKAQGGGCKICGGQETKLDHKTNAPKMLAVDHCKQTKKVRGLLCGRCNMTIGAAEHNPVLLGKMVDYLVASETAVTPLLAEPHKMILQTQWGPMSLREASIRSGLKMRTVLARIRHGWPEDQWLQPLKQAKRNIIEDPGDVI